MLRNIFLPVILAILAWGFWISPDFKAIAAGLALFMFGMLSLEQGFQAFSGGSLELVLRNSTDRLWKSIVLGITSTTIMQSSSLVSLITISFLSAGLMDLAAGIGIIFGANLGTTTGAWLVAGLGLKVKIAAYSMPMLAFGVLLIFQRSKVLKGIGHGLAGLGLLFLGIHYMKEGFEAFSQTIDLSTYAVGGYRGLFLFTLIGTLATVVLQSSHATLVLLITALASGQISYENALALAIGANLGTTITAILGSLSANVQGKRLAVAHLVFNGTTGLLAIALIAQLMFAVDWVSQQIGIRDDDYTLKLAVFHTLFNLLGLVVMTPFINRMVVWLERVVTIGQAGISQPRYLNDASLAVPTAAIASIRQELLHLYEKAFRLIAHGLSLSRGTVKSEQDLRLAAANTRRIRDIDIDRYYERHIKHLHSAIIEFITRAQAQQLNEEESTQLYALRQASRNIVEAVKEMKHLHKNLSRFLLTGGPYVRQQYDGIRVELATLLRELDAILEREGEGPAILSLDEVALGMKEADGALESSLDELIRTRRISAERATSLMNDNNYARHIAQNLMEMAATLFGSRESGMQDAEKQISLADSDLDKLMSDRLAAVADAARQQGAHDP